MIFLLLGELLLFRYLVHQCDVVVMEDILKLSSTLFLKSFVCDGQEKEVPKGAYPKQGQLGAVG